jgi:hypothetical protein
MITNFNTFDTSAYDNIKLLESYIIMLENTILKFEKRYFIILHNFLILEIAFKDIIPYTKKINENLNIKNCHNLTDLSNLFYTLYDVNGIIRNNVEYVNRIPEIMEYTENNPEIYNRIFNIKKTLKDIELKRSIKKYNL